MIEPTIVHDHPVELSPFARTTDDDPSLTERFEYFAAGMELGNAYSEINDPDEQQLRFDEQSEHVEGVRGDPDYVEALSYGMPPTGGLGLGIDRLVDAALRPRDDPRRHPLPGAPLHERVMARQYHVALEEGDVAPIVLLPGDPGRVEVVARLWDDARHVATNREYVTWTGTYRGVPISCTSTGIGAPSTSIALEELARVGATTFIRIGTCGTFLDHVAIGDMAVFDSAVRLDGASTSYAPIEFPAVASHDVVCGLHPRRRRARVPLPRRHDALGRHLLRPSSRGPARRTATTGSPTGATTSTTSGG